MDDGALRELQRSLDGRVLTPRDDDYDAARVIYNALVDARPSVIARCTRPADVATALDFARSHSLEIAVRGGGHNPAGHCICDGGLVVDLSQMRTVTVDSSSAVAHADGGATWGDFDTATQAAGLVTPGGVVVTTGVAGLTLGGGIGHLTAQHGLTCDNLIGGEIVTPDGRVLEVSADDELLWGPPRRRRELRRRHEARLQALPARRSGGRTPPVSRSRNTRGAPPVPRSRRLLSSRSLLPGRDRTRRGG